MTPVVVEGVRGDTAAVPDVGHALPETAPDEVVGRVLAQVGIEGG